MKRDRLTALLAELEQLRATPGPDAERALATVLATERSNHGVARAAAIVAEHRYATLESALIAAFDRFMANPVKTDKLCAAKAAIVDALRQLDSDEPAPLLVGIRHVQMEPVFGGREDTAVTLRAKSASGLVEMGYRDVMVELALLLADPQREARIAAARAIAHSQRDAEGVPLLRLKIALGDDEPEVASACLTALLALAPDSALDLMCRSLDGDDERAAESAALALGESRLATALAPLRAWVERAATSTRREIGFLAIAMLRSTDAVDYLIEVVTYEAEPIARDAATAFTVLRHDADALDRLERAARGRNDLDARDIMAALRD